MAHYPIALVRPKVLEGMAGYLEALPRSAAAVAKELALMDTLRDIPMTILSAGNGSPIQRTEHETLARRSSQGKTEVVRGCGHWIQVDRPDVVIQAIHGMVGKKP